MERITDRIRRACARVVATAQRVAIDDDALRRLARALEEEAHPQPPGPEALDPGAHHLGRGAETLAFLIALDAVNFGSGWFPGLDKEPGRSGYFTVATRLKRHFSREGALTAHHLQEAELDQVTRLFGQEEAHPDVADLMERFTQAWRELGTWLVENHAGRFEGPVEEAGGSAEHLVELLAELPTWRDIQVLDGFEVPFFKRAQILAADLARAFPDHPWGRFHDLDRLTLFADNLVPHVLRMEGVLRYDSSLAATIDAERLLEPHSREEIEIRASGVVAVERLRDLLAHLPRAPRAMDLDALLWERGQDPRVKAHPRHRCRGTFY